MNALDRLRHAYDNRLAAARAAHARGQAVIGFVGNTTPVELILAAGAFPLQLGSGPPRATPHADALIEKTEPWAMRDLADLALAGELSFLSLMIVGRWEDWLYYNLKEAVRQGEGERVPELHMNDLMQNTGAAIAAYNRVQVEDVWHSIERHAGGRVDVGALPAAMELMQRRRDLLAQMHALRAAGRISGVEAMQATGGSLFVAPDEGCALLSDYLVEAAARPAAATGRRLLIATAAPLSSALLHEAVEAAGARVVAEDSWWGARAGAGDMRAMSDPIDALAQFYAGETQGEDAQPRERREAWVRKRLADDDVDALVVYLPPTDKRLGWDYPGLEAAAAKLGKPTLQLRQDANVAAGRASIAEAVRGLRALGEALT